MYATRHLAFAAWLEMQGHSSSIGRFDGRPHVQFVELTPGEGRALREQYCQTTEHAIDSRALALRKELADAA